MNPTEPKLVRAIFLPAPVLPFTKWTSTIPAEISAKKLHQLSGRIEGVRYLLLTISSCTCRQAGVPSGSCGPIVSSMPPSVRRPRHRIAPKIGPPISSSQCTAQEIDRFRAGLEVGMRDHLGRADGIAQAVAHDVAGIGNVYVAVLSLEHPSRDGSRMIVAGLLGHLMRPQPPRRLEIEHEDLRLQQQGGNRLPLARAARP